MKHQQVSVDYWAMAKTMLTYAFLAAMGWLMLRLFGTAFMLPGRLRAQERTIEETLAEMQRRYPKMNITEQDLKDAEKELQEYMKEIEDKKKTGGQPGVENENTVEKSEDKEKLTETSAPQLEEDKKTI